jgi:hypothetical protein
VFVAEKCSGSADHPPNASARREAGAYQIWALPGSKTIHKCLQILSDVAHSLVSNGL